MEKTLVKRNHSLDIARLIATFTVIMVHCSADFIAFFPYPSYEFFIGNIFNSLSRIGVPLFVMISGGLFLDESKEVTLKSIFCKNIKNLAVITIIWSVLYSAIFQIIFPLLNSNTINIKEFFKGILLGHTHMWYLYMIIGLYIATPFLKKFTNKENRWLVLFFVGVCFCANSFEPVIKAISKLGPDLSIINTWIDKFRLDFFSGYIVYFLIGWYIVHIGISQRWLIYLIYFLGAASAAFIVVFVHFTGDYSNMHKNIGAPVFLYAVSVFLALNSIRIRLKEKTAKILTQLSKLAFGVYIIHMLVLTVFCKLFPYSNHCTLYIVTSFVSVSCISFSFSYILSKTPLLKKMIKM